MVKGLAQMRPNNQWCGFKGKVGNGKFDSHRPVDAHVKGGDGISQMCLQARSRAVHEFLEVQDAREKREHGFNRHALVPASFLAHFEAGRAAFSGVGLPLSLVTIKLHRLMATKHAPLVIRSGFKTACFVAARNFGPLFSSRMSNHARGKQDEAGF